MKLDRNDPANGYRGKYALIKLRQATVKLAPIEGTPSMVMVEESAVDFGDDADSDFFVIRLKDKYAGDALHAYADAAFLDDEEYAGQIRELALKAQHHPRQRKPD